MTRRRVKFYALILAAAESTLDPKRWKLGCSLGRRHDAMRSLSDWMAKSITGMIHDSRL
jgi:hypothetical protein